MKMRKTAATAILAATAIAVTTATANAAPQAGDQPPAAVHYEVHRDGGSAVLSTSDGTLKIIADQLILTDHNERPVAAIPLTYQLDNTAHPINAHIDGITATLTPSKDNPRPAQPVSRDQIIPVDKAAQIAESINPRDMQALGTFTQRVTIGAAVSAILGAVLGGGIGCLVGGAAGAAVSSPVIFLLAPFVGATIAGCVLGAATLGAVGSMAGLILAGGPITLFAAIQYFSTILTPCPPNVPACKDPLQPAATAK
ncbi:hypothetical protein [Nocardia africana]|uniref:DUF8020 domain-containing protein n=1 Tax=Nocardia africana TaxID=134964 RepID=A0A378WWM9_9NOCA|nr:hypothetical protein [Nocardia africana]MCC3312920.1 hypothetical protein [Nocardia africana]SUA45740.1 Uncharacterised protein [Nocardia africana]